MWQPIETAPRDGTYLLLFYPKRGQDIWLGHYVVSEHITNGKISFRSEGWICMGEMISLRPGTDSDADLPTHWMPLPSAPPIIQKDEAA